jgi:hypothetical protein
MVRNLDQNAASKAIVVPRISRGADGGLHSALSVLAQSVISALFPGDSWNYRLVLAAVVTTALLTSGCSDSKPTVPTPAKSPSAQATASAPATAEETTRADAPPAEKLDVDACVEVTGANLDLATATTADDARKAGDAFEKYDLPAGRIVTARQPAPRRPARRVWTAGCRR